MHARTLLTFLCAPPYFVEAGLLSNTHQKGTHLFPCVLWWTEWVCSVVERVPIAWGESPLQEVFVSF